MSPSEEPSGSAIQSSSVKVNLILLSCILLEVVCNLLHLTCAKTAYMDFALYAGIVVEHGQH